MRVLESAGPCEVLFVNVPAGVRTNAARNAGIRAAHGEYVLATNAGVLFSNELMRRFAARDLDAGRMYRMDVYVVDSPDAAEADRPRAVYAREGTFPVTDDGLRRNAAEDIAPVGSGLHFGEGWFAAEKYPGTGETFRWMRSNAEIRARVPGGGGILVLEIEPGPGLGPAPR